MFSRSLTCMVVFGVHDPDVGWVGHGGRHLLPDLAPQEQELHLRLERTLRVLRCPGRLHLLRRVRVERPVHLQSQGPHKELLARFPGRHHLQEHRGKLLHREQPSP